LENVKNTLPLARLCNIAEPRAIQVIPIEPDKSDAAQYRIAFSSGYILIREIEFTKIPS
jgi:hypothetical protein